MPRWQPEEETHDGEPGPTTRLLGDNATRAPTYDPEARGPTGEDVEFESFPLLHEPGLQAAWPLRRNSWRVIATVAVVVVVSTVALALFPSGGAHSGAKKASFFGTQSSSLAASTSSSSSSSSSSISRPHVIFFIVDDLGVGDVDLESGSDTENITPTLAAMSQSGIRLERYYTLPVCTPARASFLTGKYPLRLGMQHSVIEAAAPWGLRPKDMIFSEVMKQQGYHTALVGKWHLGHYEKSMTPQERGFDTFFGHYTGAIHRFAHTAWHACDSTYHTNETCYYDVHSADDLVRDKETFVTDLLTQKAKSVLTGHASQNTTDPLFLIMSYPNVHTPNDAPDYVKADSRLKSVDVTCRRTYLADLMTVDLSVAEILESLKSNGMYDNSLLVVLSDNGADPAYCGSNFPYRGKKGSLFEAGVLVPAFLAGGLIPEDLQGSAYQGLVHVSDWVPTIVQGLLKSTLPSDYDVVAMDGINQWDALLETPTPSSSLRRRRARRRRLGEETGGEEEEEEEEIPVVGPKSEGEIMSGEDGEGSEMQPSIVEYPRQEIIVNIDGYDDRAKPEAAVIKGDWKLILNSRTYGWWVPSASGSSSSSSETYEHEVNSSTLVTSFLFNLALDPFERVNLYDDRPDIVATLSARLRDYNATGVYATPLYTECVYEEAFDVWDETGFVTPYADEADDMASTSLASPADVTARGGHLRA